MAQPTQPPPSWAELTSRLEALLQRLEAPSSLADLASLADGCWYRRSAVGQAALGGAPPAAAAAGPSP